jgi:small subunit ribosomal protein S21
MAATRAAHFFRKATCTERRRINHMPEVQVRKGEPIDRALKRLKGKLDAEGIMDEVRRLRAFETPTQKTRRKAKANAKRAKAKKQQRLHFPM